MDDPGSTAGEPARRDNGTAKAELRGPMRARRRAIDDAEHRSRRIVELLVELVEARRASGRPADRVHLFASIPGEPDTAPFRSWCDEHGIAVATPDDPVDGRWPDLVVVPGLAFTEAGERLGQGGGWYDRFLADRSPGTLVVGVAFEPQVIDAVPTDAHDVPMDCVVTDAGARWCP